MTITYDVPFHSLGILEKTLFRLNRSTQHLGLFPSTFSFSLISPRVIDQKQVPMAKVLVSGDAPLFHDHMFVAAEDGVSGEFSHNYYALPGYEFLLAARKPRWCDHCQQEVQGSGTFYLEDSNKKVIQVAGSCLGSYLGIQSVLPLLSCISQFWQLITLLSSSEVRVIDQVDFEDKKSGYVIPLVDYLEYVADCYGSLGWVGRNTRSMAPPTASVALSLFFGQANPSVQCCPSIRKLIPEALEWLAKKVDDRVAYIFNLKKACSSGYFDINSLNLVASLIVTYLRKTGPVSKGFLGEIGDNLFDLPCKVISVTNYGDKQLVNVMSADGYALSWYSKKRYIFNQDVHLVSGFIRDHREYRGQQYTVLDRCVVKEEQ